MTFKALYDPKFIPNAGLPEFVKISILCINPFSPSFLQKFYLSKDTIDKATKNFEEAKLVPVDQVEKYKKRYRHLGLLTVVRL